MNIILKLRLLQYFAHKNEQQGSIWFKLIFALIFLGGLLIVGAYFLGGGCVNKAHQGIARNRINTINLTQQAYFSEYKTLAQSMEQLGIQEETEHYIYSLKADKNSTFHYAIVRSKGILFGLFDKKIKSYVGAVFIDPKIQDSAGEMLSIAIICENNSPSNIYPSQPTFNNGVASCGAGTTNLSR
ncbi:MAG TPA: type IV pilin-like G/H family protein [Nostocaceae cyanobacterium]|nr:type IV pilin-like G/H family protein [Nostocaceae cyanobacterium]